jgi:hypothetical protein
MNKEMRPAYALVFAPHASGAQALRTPGPSFEMDL